MLVLSSTRKTVSKVLRKEYAVSLRPEPLDTETVAAGRVVVLFVLL
jgi:hypothetical protein